MKKVIYITWNYESRHFPEQPDEEDRFYTYGFGSTLSRKFKLYCPDWEVECWRLAWNVNKYHEKIVQGVKMRVFPSVQIIGLGDFSIRFLLALRKEVKRSDPLLFVTHIHHWLMYQVAYFFRKQPIVVSSHGEYSPFFRITVRKGIKKLKAFIEMQIEKVVLKNVNRFLLCDHYQVPYIIKAASEKSIIFSTNGVNLENIYPIPRLDARRQLGWDMNKKYILYVGLLYKEKMAKEMIDIWKEIKKERSEVELVIIGNTSEDEFTNYAIESGAMALGRILNKELYKYYSAADVYILLSIREDWFGGVGIAPLESLACNTPVVSRSLQNYFGDNVYELGELPKDLGEYKNAIIKVLDNPKRFKNMRESVMKYYSWEFISNKTEHIFEEVKMERNK